MLRHSADGRVSNLNRAGDGLKIWVGCCQMKFMSLYVSNYMKLNFIYSEKASRLGTNWLAHTWGSLGSGLKSSSWLCNPHSPSPIRDPRYLTR